MLSNFFVLKNYIYVYSLFIVGVLYPNLISSQSTQTGKPQKVDSVEIYLATSKNDSFTRTERLNLLLKGVDYAKNIKDDTQKSKAFSKLSYSLYKEGDSTLFRQSNRTAIILAKKNKDSIVLAEAYWDLGAFYQRIMLTDSAYYSFSRAQQLYDAKDNLSLSARLLLIMASQQEAIKDYVGSEASIIQAIEILKPLEDFKQLYHSYNQLGIVTKDLGNYDKAIEHYNTALFYANKFDSNKKQLLSVKNNLGVVYQRKKEFASAVQNFNAVLSTEDIKINNTGLYAIALNNLAFSRIQLKDTIGVKNSIEESIRIKDSLDLHSSASTNYLSLAEYYWFKKDTIASISAALKSKQIAFESSNNEKLLETLEFLTKIDVENASTHALAYFDLNKSLQLEERRARNKFAKIRFETDEFIAENQVLSEEKEVLSEEKEILSKQNQIWAALAVGFFLFGIAIYIIVDQRSKNQKLRFQQQQQFNNQEIFNLMLSQKQKVDEVKRMEQKRISEELHDGVLGKMLGARMILTGLNKKANEDSIKQRSEAIVALKSIENELRSISHELSHTAYQKINNFVSSIESLLTSATDKTGIRTIFNYNEDEEWDSLIGDIKINVYRIIQENIQNAIKHSGCSNFFVNFEIKEGLYLVTVGDNGKGFTFDKERKGIGLRNIKSRVLKMNGNLNINTGLGNGTVMIIEIPVHYSEMTLENTTN